MPCIYIVAFASFILLAGLVLHRPLPALASRRAGLFSVAPLALGTRKKTKAWEIIQRRTLRKFIPSGYGRMSRGNSREKRGKLFDFPLSFLRFLQTISEWLSRTLSSGRRGRRMPASA